jgi:hypothetical protein
VLVLVLAVLSVSYASSMRAYLEQKEHLASLRESIADSKANIAALEREKRRWRDEAYVEAQATERLGWVMPGEISFQVIDEDGEPLDHEDSLSDPGAVEVENEPAWWQTAWASMEAAGHPEDVSHPVEQIERPRKQDRKHKQ